MLAARKLSQIGTSKKIPQLAVWDTGNFNPGAYVAKSGDTMTGPLTVNSTITSSSACSFGSVSTFISGNGYVNLLRGDAVRSGYIEFIGANGIRQGYIGFSPTNGAINGGVISYIGSSHSFNGTITSTGNITAYFSDGRLKKNVRPIPNALQKVLELGGYVYDWDLEKCSSIGFTPERPTEHGLIAQEVQLIIPEAVAPAPGDNEYLTIRYEKLVSLLMAAVSEQQKQIDELRMLVMKGKV